MYIILRDNLLFSQLEAQYGMKFMEVSTKTGLNIDSVRN